MAVFDRCDFKAQMETILNRSLKKRDGSTQKYYKLVDQTVSLRKGDSEVRSGHDRFVRCSTNLGVQVLIFIK